MSTIREAIEAARWSAALAAQASGPLRTVYAQGPATLYEGDALAVLSGLPSLSAHALVTDPPYALGSGRPRVGFRYCLRYIMLGVDFPNLHNADPLGGEGVNFTPVSGDGALLRGVVGGVGARIGVPVGSVNFESDTEIRQPKVNDKRKPTKAITEGELRNETHTDPPKFGGYFALKLRDDVRPSFCEGACSCYRKLGAGRIAVRVLAFPSTSLPGAQTGGVAIPGSRNGVRARDDSARGTGGASGVVAGARTERSAMLTLDLRGRTYELAPADSAGQGYFTLARVTPERVGAGTRARRLPAMPQSSRVGAVDGAADGAHPVNVIALHQSVTSFLADQIKPRKGFMGKAWDTDGIAFSVDFWREALRVVRPGAHAIVFGGTRTYHRLVSAMEDAGWEIRDSIVWMFGTGFPKSKNLGDGRGTALKPAHEPIILARAPLAESSVAANVLAHGTGALNIDATRIGIDLGEREIIDRRSGADDGLRDGIYHDGVGKRAEGERFTSHAAGRWPANVVLTCCGFSPCVPGCPVREIDLQSGIRSSHDTTPGGQFIEPNVRRVAYHDQKMTKRPPGRGDTGGASRFMYVAKPSRRERDRGLSGMPARSGGEATRRTDGSAGLSSPRAGSGRTGGARNTHSTVKPVQLMRYLCRLITPPGGVVLDPFMGSGTTGIAAMLEGFRFVGGDDGSEPNTVEIARRRLAAWQRVNG